MYLYKDITKIRENAKFVLPEIAEAKKNIKAKYAKQTNAAWAEDEYSKNLRELCKKLWNLLFDLIMFLIIPRTEERGVQWKIHTTMYAPSAGQI